MRQWPQFVRVFPCQNLRQCVRPSNKKQLTFRPLCAQISQRIHRICYARSVNINSRNSESRVGGRCHHAHEISVLGGAEVFVLSLRVSGGYENYFIEIESVCNLTRSH